MKLEMEEIDVVPVTGIPNSSRTEDMLLIMTKKESPAIYSQLMKLGGFQSFRNLHEWSVQPFYTIF